jgi:hypothetical protein
MAISFSTGVGRLRSERETFLSDSSKQPVSAPSGLFLQLYRDGETLVSVWIERGRDLLHSMFAAPEDPVRLSPLPQASSGQVLETVPKLGLGGVCGQRVGSIYDRVPGSSTGEPGVHR